MDVLVRRLRGSGAERFGAFWSKKWEEICRFLSFGALSSTVFADFCRFWRWHQGIGRMPELRVKISYPMDWVKSKRTWRGQMPAFAMYLGKDLG